MKECCFVRGKEKEKIERVKIEMDDY